MEVMYLWMQEHQSSPAETGQKAQRDWEGASLPTLGLWTPSLQSPWLQPSVSSVSATATGSRGSEQPAWSEMH